jgi:hypothetical protein
MQSASLLSLLLFLYIGLFSSLASEWRLRSGLATEYIRLLCSLSFSISLSVSFSCSFSLSLSSSARSSSHSLSLPTEWRLESRLSTVCIRLLYSLSFSFPLSVPSARSFSARFHFRLNRGFGANFRLNAFGSSTPSLFLSHRYLPTVPHTVLRLWNTLSTLHFSDLSFLSMGPSTRSFSRSLSLCR